MAKIDRKTLSKFTVKPLDQEQFHRLYDILVYGVFGGNYNAVARILGISRVTAKRWITDAPPNPWMNYILSLAIKECIKWLNESTVKKHKKRAAKAKGMLQREKLHEISEMIEWQEYTHSGCRGHLLRVLMKAPARMMSSADLQKPAHSGGYSMRSLRNAAAQLGLEKETKGFGPQKQTWFYLPDEES